MPGPASFYSAREKASRRWLAVSLTTIFAATAILYGASKTLASEPADAAACAAGATYVQPQP